MQLYLSNEACRRNGTCERADLLPELNPWQYEQLLLGESNYPQKYEIVRRAGARVLKFCESVARPGFRCLIGLGLESNFSHEAARWLRWVLIFDGWERDQIVYNPVDDRPDSGAVAYWHEHHELRSDVNAHRQIVTLDGWDSDLCSGGKFGLHTTSAELVRRWLLGGNYGLFAAWCPGWQGLPARPGQLRAVRDFKLHSVDLRRWAKLFNSVR
jgi:hypothetical protein